MSAFARVIFAFLNPIFLGVLALLLGTLYIYKYRMFNAGYFPKARADRTMYLVRAMNWSIFGIALVAAIYLPELERQLILRVAIGFMLISEVAYNFDNLVLMLNEAREGLKKKLGKLSGRQ